MTDEGIVKKFEQISDLIKGKKVLVAFSGGVDSTLILLLCLKYALNTIPVFFTGPIFSKYEFDAASELCSALNTQLQVVEHNPLKDENFVRNSENRCYYCKKAIMQYLTDIKKELNYDLIVEGTNESEIQGHRPGYKALQELNILSPFLRVKMNKKEIRESIAYISANLSSFLGKEYNNDKLVNLLESIKNKPSNPCLSTRVEYNLELNAKMLLMIQKAESWLRQEFNLDILRVRLHRNYIARIEVLPEKIVELVKFENSAKIVNKFKEIGFNYVTIDLQGFRSGSGLEIL